VLKQRILTALILAPIALLAVFFLPLDLFSVFVAVALLIGAWEWTPLSGVQRLVPRVLYVLGLALLLWSLQLLLSPAHSWVLLLIALAFWGVALYWVVRYPDIDGWGSSVLRLLLGLLVLIPCWIALVELRRAESDALLVMLLLLVWGADVGAYAAGKTFGRTKLAPAVSPGKTREGFWGGIFSCLVIGVGFSIYLELSLLAQVALVMLALVTGMASVLGDLFESMLKRHSGIKDSGNILPGHGGVLDRIDSLTAAAPVFVLGSQLLLGGV